jgi:tetratricopeptide (TPR) repeat protein
MTKSVYALLAAAICFASGRANLLAALGDSQPQAQQNQQKQEGQQGQQGQQGQPGQQGQQGQAQPGQQGQAQQGQQGAPQASPQEGEDFQSLRNEAQAALDPDKIIQLGADFEKKYPQSAMLTYADMFVASAYQQKGDADKAIEYGEKSLKLNPDNLMSLIITSTLLPTPQGLKNAGMDKDKRLTEAETDANKALDLIQKLPKQPNEADDAFNKRKSALAADLHSALGMVHLQRSLEGLAGPDTGELSKAEQEYKAAVATDKPNPQDYYRLGETYARENKIDDAITAFSKASELGQGTGIDQYANQQIAELKKRKAQAGAPSPPK